MWVSVTMLTLRMLPAAHKALPKACGSSLSTGAPGDPLCPPLRTSRHCSEALPPAGCLLSGAHLVTATLLACFSLLYWRHQALGGAMRHRERKAPSECPHAPRVQASLPEHVPPKSVQAPLGQGKHRPWQEAQLKSSHFFRKNVQHRK